MEKLLNKFAFNQLSRSELKSILGAAFVKSECGGGTYVKCTGSTCMGQDYSGCSCMQSDGTIEKKSCSPPIA
jgi:hypothetical protein